MNIERLEHDGAQVAAAIHRVMVLAYTQEARLLKIQDFTPLALRPEDIRQSDYCYLGAHEGDRLVGVVGFGPDDEPDQFVVSSLVVDPEHQRRGIARSLMKTVLQLDGGFAVAVSTAEGNAPALALYRELGFVAYRHGTAGPELLPLVKLRRASTNPRPVR